MRHSPARSIESESPRWTGSDGRLVSSLGTAAGVLFCVACGSTGATASSTDASTEGHVADAAQDAGTGARGDSGSPDAAGSAPGDSAATVVPSPDAGASVGDITVDTTKPGTVVPDTFLGISCEWSSVPGYLGDGSGHAYAPALQLVRNFAAEGHSPTVRIGGNSADEAWWDPSGVASDAAKVTVDIGPVAVATIAAWSTALGTLFIPDLDLALGDAANAGALVSAVYAAVPRSAVRAFEIGNEPDLWAGNGLRSAGYTFMQWQSDYDAFTAGIDAVVSAPYAAPAISGTSWLSDLPGFYAHEASNLALVTAHHYPFNVCNGKAAPPPGDLLGDSATTDYATTYQAPVAAARAAGLDFRMAELNSVACGGAPGVSDAYVAALWGADVAFELASVGAVGLNFHTPSNYAVFTNDTGMLVVKALYYGMRLFSLATAAGGKLLPTTVTTTSRAHAFATLGSDGAVRVAILSLDAADGGTVTLHVAGVTSASLVRMHGPAIDATTGITLGGQTWDSSTDGTPLGSPTIEAPELRAGTIAVALPPLDAVVVTLR
jgi:hypothetical protein